MQRSSKKGKVNRSSRISQVFGQNALTLAALAQQASGPFQKEVQRILDGQAHPSTDFLKQTASFVQDWALEKGVTHFCHWFAPLTGLTAQKQESFIKFTDVLRLETVDSFSSHQLTQSEPDASSFPSGGMRSTFEARGYCVWDPFSFFFIMEDGSSKTLCIPSIFFSYNGEALDFKIPLYRALQKLNEKAVTFYQEMGYPIQKVKLLVGIEQEFFLIPRSFYLQRPDLKLLGRSLMGLPPVRGQQFEDHYFRSIPTDVLSFFDDLQWQLYKLGVPVKTRHNEVAPGQFELAPYHTEAHLACDQNLLIMEMLQKVARTHEMTCLLDEKPFAFVNGSGKHCNWSLSGNDSINLLEPGQDPEDNLRFLLTILVVLKAINDHSLAFRASVASRSNDLRLGANEAPPAIISVFLGHALDQALKQIENHQQWQLSSTEIVSLGLNHIPNVSRDYSDRNRTSPFAFTGNKFEMRALGSSANPALTLMVLSASLADAFDKATTLWKSIKQASNRSDALKKFLKNLILETKNIRFEGNNYSQEWIEEARQRGLPIISSALEAYEAFFKSPREYGFLINLGILTEKEVQSFYHVLEERYLKTIKLEADLMLQINRQRIIPILRDEITKWLSMVNNVSIQEPIFNSSSVMNIKNHVAQLVELLHEIQNKVQQLDSAASNQNVVLMLTLAQELRVLVNECEKLTTFNRWPLVKHEEILWAFY